MSSIPKPDGVGSFDDFMSYTNKMFDITTPQNDCDQKNEEPSTPGSVTSKVSNAETGFAELERPKSQRSIRRWTKAEEDELSLCVSMDAFREFARVHFRTLPSVRSRHRRLVLSGKVQEIANNKPSGLWTDEELEELGKCSTYKELREYSSKSFRTHAACKKKRIKLSKENPTIRPIEDKERNVAPKGARWTQRMENSLLSCRTIEDVWKMANRYKLSYESCKNKFYAAVNDGRIVRMDKKRVVIPWTQREIELLSNCKSTKEVRELCKREKNGRTVNSWRCKFLELRQKSNSKDG